MISVFSTRFELLNQWIVFRKIENESVAVGGQPSPAFLKLFSSGDHFH